LTKWQLWIILFLKEKPVNVGQRIKQLRGKMSQKEFAGLCGIDDTTISKIEGGSLTGTLEIHRKICQALGISLATLYQGVYEEDIKSTETAPPVEEKPFRYNPKATSQFLTRNIFVNKKMLPEILILEPGGEASEELPPDTQRFLYALEGEVEIRIGNNIHRLRQGEPLYVIDASIPHSIRNTGTKPARVLRVTSPVRL